MAMERKMLIINKLVSACLGIAVGLFVGILILGTLVRVIFSSIFGWGDSAPEWGMWTEGIITAGITVTSLYFSLKWTMGQRKNRKRYNP